jgi:hypothetical protein
MRARLQTRGLWRTVALVVLLLLPVAYLLSLVAKYGVNVPYADEFTFVPLLVKAHEHSVTWFDLFKQHNEHRYFFTRLLFIAFAWLAKGDLRAEMFFSVFLAILASVNLWLLVRKTISSSPGQSLVLVFLFNILLFSPVQAENWTWGFQLTLFFCNYLFTCALLAAVSDLSVSKKFAVCLFFALVATFSFGGGVMLWPLTFPLVFFIHREMRWKPRIAWGVAWGAAALGALALYFFHYVKPPYHPSIAASRNPADYFFYVTTFLGAHLSRAARGESIFQAALVGSVLLGLWSIAVACAVRYRRDLDLMRRLLPWIALGSYSVINALLAAAARIGFGVNQALDSRYTSFSLYLSVAVLGLFAILKQELQARATSPLFQGAVVRLETILLTAFAVFSLTAFSWGRTFMIDSHRTRLWGKGALLFSNVMDSGEIHDHYLMANAPEARAYANMLDSIGLMHPRMIATAEISKLNAKTVENIGYLDFLTESGPSCSAVGWAVLPKTGTRAHCIILSYEDPSRGPIAFRVADEIHNRPDVAAVLQNPAAEESGWSCHFDRSVLPPGNLVLRAWAFDANRAILYPLGTPKILH